MSLQIPEALLAKFRQDPFARHLGIVLEEVRPGYARTALTITPDLLNFHGIPHGGAIFSLADAAFAAASNSHGQAAVALSMTIQFLGAAPCGARLAAEAQELRKGRRAGFYEITVKAETGEPIAVVQAVVHRKSQMLVAEERGGAEEQRG